MDLVCHYQLLLVFASLSLQMGTLPHGLLWFVSRVMCQLVGRASGGVTAHKS